MNENDCPICLEPIKDAGYIVLKCKHRMDLDCYFGCKRNKINKCPLCRAIINEYVEEIEEVEDTGFPTPPPRRYPRHLQLSRGDFFNDYNFWDNPAVAIYPSPPQLSFERHIRRNQIPYNFAFPEGEDEYIQMPRDENFITTPLQCLILDKVFANCALDITLAVAVYKFNNRVENYSMMEYEMQSNLDTLFENGFIRKMETNYRRIV